MNTREELIRFVVDVMLNHPVQPSRIVWFHYPPLFVVRDLSLPRDQQEIWHGPDYLDSRVREAYTAALEQLSAAAILAAIEVAGARVGPKDPTISQVIAARGKPGTYAPGLREALCLAIANSPRFTAALSEAKT